MTAQLEHTLKGEAVLAARFGFQAHQRSNLEPVAGFEVVLAAGEAAPDHRTCFLIVRFQIE